MDVSSFSSSQRGIWDNSDARPAASDESGHGIAHDPDVPGWCMATAARPATFAKNVHRRHARRIGIYFCRNFTDWYRGMQEHFVSKIRKCDKVTKKITDVVIVIHAFKMQVL